jgi:uncharacterized membrane protein HdeD (DUF308 family)
MEDYCEGGVDMTIPELMYGTWRYNVHDYSGGNFNHHQAQGAEGASLSTTSVAIAIRNPAWSIVWSLLLIILGLLAIGLPLATSFGVVLIIGWPLILSSAIQVLHAFRSRGIPRIVWKSLVALLCLGVGIYLIAHPLLGVAGMTLAIGLFSIAEAMVDFFGYLRSRKSVGSGWILFDGIGTLILGLLIWRQWPLSSFWAIGALVGISMLMTGTTRLMITLAARKHGEAYVQ